MPGCLSENELLAGLDGQLPSEQARRQQEHIDGCPSCFELFAALGEAGTRSAPEADGPTSGRSIPAPGGPLAAPPDLLSNQRFQVLRPLGAGGMGVVYEAHDRQRQGPVALKTLRSFSPEALLRFKREFRSVQDISHPNLVRYGELFESGGSWFFSMELLLGQDFVRHLRSRRAGGAPFDEGRLRAALGQLWQGLSALHLAGKVHRDIKPGNVLCTEQGRLVLLDFGLVADLVPESLWTESGVVGTIAYMAPEQAAGAAAGPAADLYSVGVMLFEVLTGRLPLSGPPLEVLQRKQSEDPPPPRALVPEIPADLNDLCVALLRRDPAARPTAVELAAGPAWHPPREGRPASPGPAAGPVFIGRQAELLALRQAYAASRGGQTLTVLCEGESGIGKSALLARFAHELRAPGPDSAGAVVLAGRCYERESVPYKTLDGILDELSRWLRHLPTAEAAAVVPRHAALLCQVFPVLSRVSALREAPAPTRDIADPQERRVRLFQAVRELLTRVAERWPLVLIIDDLQWADEDGLLLLSEVLRAPDEPPLLLLCTQRPGCAPDGERGPGFLRRARRLALSPLSPDEGAELVRWLRAQAGLIADSDPRDLAVEAGGHPLFIAELLRHGAPAAGGARAEAPRLDQALFARMERLATDDRDLLDHLAVSGTPLAPEVLGRALGVDPDEVRERAGRLHGAALVRSAIHSGDYTLEIYHDRVREALLLHLRPEVQRDCHQHLAVALLDQPGADAEAPARHFLAAGATEQAAQHAERAADHAFAAMAFERAARLYQLALQLAPQRTHLRQRLGDALAGDGRGPQAAAAYLAAATTAPQQQALVLRSRAAEQLVRTGHLGPGLATLHANLKDVGIRLPRTPSWALVSLIFQRIWLRLRGLRYRSREATTLSAADLGRVDLCYSAAIVLVIVDRVRGLDLYTRHLIQALRIGERYRMARGLLGEAQWHTVSGPAGRRRAAEIIRLAEPLYAQADEPFLHALARGVQAQIYLFNGQYGAARAHLADAIEILLKQCQDVACELAGLEFLLALCLWGLGDMGELDRLVGEVLRRARDRGNLHQISHMLPFGVLTALAEDDREEAGRRLAEVRGLWLQPGSGVIPGLFQEAQLLVDLYDGQGQIAYRNLQALWPAMMASGVRHIRQAYIWQLDVRARSLLAGAGCAKAAERPHLLLAVEREVRRIERAAGPEGPRFAGTAAQLRAGVAAARGDRAGALAGYAESAAALAQTDLRLHAAVARRRQGELAGGAAGQVLIAGAEAWMSAHGIKSPQRWCDMLAPRPGPG